MNWLTSWIPKIRSERSESVPDDLWHKCNKCEEMIFRSHMVDNMWVCTICDHHERMRAHHRLVSFFGSESNFKTEIPPRLQDDPINFSDTVSYKSRLKKARAKCDMDDCFEIGVGKLEGNSVVALAMDFAFIGGSMGRALGNAIVHAAEISIRNKIPLVLFSSSGGARMQEGIFSLMQMARTTIAVKKVKDAGIPYISVLCDPTTGGVQASFAMLGTVTLAEPGALVGFAGKRVIQQTIGEELPKDFQSSEFQFKNGFVDKIVHRSKIALEINRIINILK
ncbi:acetyl-CoA carboxylase carboxyl transferase subunit beta [Candidatus Cytomitobacter indipagum]|uniref:Acetyl-coenzyme A carboxylase carboxyl transferase subunit beta n=1 Tax=Candidatus Cytomitobacter indipagum TaxID=2601575 RepID=A0A5C0UDT0_9PROT|nr:acetyl-CoA carboxylase carboxyltransferase subunit beta [Candidatus Cytomitobacter indipagum]QEK38158.1 acetyl-CoA carboxylase carboxyl transferase subunit beta [Candidatus Cytomitobacter indipagum]